MILRAVALVAAFATLASAQEIRGVIRDAQSGQPVPGAVVQLIGEAGSEVSRTLTNETGAYRLRIPATGRIRVLRLGFRPFEQVVPALEGGAARLDVQLRPLATMLEIVKVVDQPGCPRRNDRAAAMALWEQAKTGLLASVVSRELLPGDMRVLVFQRWLSPSTERITEQTVRRHDGSAASSFRSSRSAGDFVKDGFISETGNRVYDAPDADILLDDRFVRAYCFSIASRERGRTGQIGLSFAPQRFTRNISTVQGTLWIDTVARRLSDIKYTYYSEGSRTRSGGELSFLELENGLVLIDRWSIRMVSNGGAYIGNSSAGVRGVEGLDAALGPADLWTRMNDGGGELARATFPGFTWRAPLGVLSARVVSKTGQPIAGAKLRLTGTDYTGTTDSIGMVRIDELLPGPYAIEIEDSTLATIGLPLVTKAKFSAERDHQSDLTIEALSAEDHVAKLCGEAGVLDRASEMIIARIFDPAGIPVPKANWKISYFNGTSDSDGIVVLCKGLKEFTKVPVIAWQPGGAETTFDVELRRKLTTLRIQVAVPTKP